MGRFVGRYVCSLSSFAATRFLLSFFSHNPQRIANHQRPIFMSLWIVPNSGNKSCPFRLQLVDLPPIKMFLPSSRPGQEHHRHLQVSTRQRSCNPLPPRPQVARYYKGGLFNVLVRLDDGHHPLRKQKRQHEMDLVERSLIGQYLMESISLSGRMMRSVQIKTSVEKKDPLSVVSFKVVQPFYPPCFVQCISTHVAVFQSRKRIDATMIVCSRLWWDFWVADPIPPIQIPQSQNRNLGRKVGNLPNVCRLPRTGLQGGAFTPTQARRKKTHTFRPTTYYSTARGVAQSRLEFRNSSEEIQQEAENHRESRL